MNATELQEELEEARRLIEKMKQQGRNARKQNRALKQSVARLREAAQFAVREMVMERHGPFAGEYGAISEAREKLKKALT